MTTTQINALIRAALAAVLGLVLLSGGGGTFASWREGRSIVGKTITAGSLGLTPQSASVTVAHTDFVAGATDITQVQRTTTDITGQASTYPLVPGDQVTVRIPMTLTMVGTNLRATLAVSPSALNSSSTALLNEINANNPTFTVTPSGAAPALTSTGTNQWAVTPASNGSTYVATMVYTVRATTDGAARTDALTNWWQATLQGTSLDARTLPFTLTQN